MIQFVITDYGESYRYFNVHLIFLLNDMVLSSDWLGGKVCIKCPKLTKLALKVWPQLNLNAVFQYNVTPLTINWKSKKKLKMAYGSKLDVRTVLINDLT